MTRPWLRTVLVALALVAPGAGGAAAQIPETFENLKVLPKDIGQRDLISVMRNYAGALGVRCHYCHMGEPGPSLDGYDFVSDEKPQKKIARSMMKMVQEINDKHIAPIETGHAKKVEVSCRTCHHGQERPQTLHEVLAEAHAEGGKDALLARYNELYDNYHGRDSFDFGEWSLDGLAQELGQDGKMEDALALMELHAGKHGPTSHLETMLGELRFRSGDKAKAKAHFEKALELDAGNRMAKRRLEQLKE